MLFFHEKLTATASRQNDVVARVRNIHSYMQKHPGFVRARIARYLGNPNDYLVMRWWRTPEDLANLPIKALVGRKQAALTDDGQLEVDHDPRVTPFGRLLRKTSLDELPNFINVLKGDMHLVGPRADIAENIKYYPEHHRAKLAVRPGVTGLAQINGRGRLSFLQTNEYDLEYVRIRSLAADLRIIGKTILVTLRGDGAV